VSGVLVRSGVTEPVAQYRLWGGALYHQCLCDPGFHGPDCSLRQCPRGPDPLAGLHRHCGTGGCVDEVQTFALSAESETTYRIGFRTWSGAERHAVVALTTTSAGGQSGEVNAKYIANALLRGISDHVFDRIAVSGTGLPGSVQTFEVTFVSNPGDHEALSVEPIAGPGTVVGGVVGTLVHGTKEEIECSGRGMCNEETGLCECFEGYGREDCGAQLSPTLYLQRHRAAEASKRRRRERELKRKLQLARADAHSVLQLRVGELEGDAEDLSFVS